MDAEERLCRLSLKEKGIRLRTCMILAIGGSIKLQLKK